MVRTVELPFDPDPTLVVGKDGVWRYRNQPIEHAASLRLFKANLRQSGKARWRTHWNDSSLKVTIQGPPLLVRRFTETEKGFEALLDTGRQVALPHEALRVVDGHPALCVDGVLAAIRGEAALALQEHLEENDDGTWTWRGHPLQDVPHWSTPC